jgi:hypothetical protein
MLDDLFGHNKKQEITSVGEDVEKLEHLSTVGGKVKLCGHHRKQYAVSKKKKEKWNYPMIQ